jgi:hypothetical protein
MAERYENLKFTDDMGDLSNKTFKEVFESNQEFVDFSRQSMTKGTGIFKFWLKYLILLEKTNGK